MQQAPSGKNVIGDFDRPPSLRKKRWKFYAGRKNSKKEKGKEKKRGRKKLVCPAERDEFKFFCLVFVRLGWKCRAKKNPPKAD
jgi:hypothetical protein